MGNFGEGKGPKFGPRMGLKISLLIPLNLSAFWLAFCCFVYFSLCHLFRAKRRQLSFWLFVVLLSFKAKRQHDKMPSEKTTIRLLISRLCLSSFRLNFVVFSFSRLVVFSPRQNEKTTHCNWHKPATIFHRNCASQV
jgi:hypothetical protein